jgi:hypothetical protein
MEPKVGQIWQMDFANAKHFIFITNVKSNGFQVRYYYLGNPEKTDWNYLSVFVDGTNYKLVSG